MRGSARRDHHRAGGGASPAIFARAAPHVPPVLLHTSHQSQQRHHPCRQPCALQSLVHAQHGVAWRAARHPGPRLPLKRCCSDASWLSRRARTRSASSARACGDRIAWVATQHHSHISTFCQLLDVRNVDVRTGLYTHSFQWLLPHILHLAPAVSCVLKLLVRLSGVCGNRLGLYTAAQLLLLMQYSTHAITPPVCRRHFRSV